MIYLASDPHGGESMAGIQQFLEKGDPSDLLILLGDVGLFFTDTEENRHFNEWFLSLDREIAFVDGNHENFDYLNSLPTDTWCGGEVHRLSKNIVHLERGNVYRIHGKTFFVMGGCISSAKWKEMGLWYPDEDPSPEEIAFGYDNLMRHDNKVDYILTHRYDDCRKTDITIDPPVSLGGISKYIDTRVQFRHWYCGHGHCALCFDEKHTMVYDDPLTIPL